ncbi:M23 family metallopeptidase [Nocardioides sp. MAHUQ-72]|uniref:M23 family metallopeptidase n=1 Tax=unclassified Nocardioides TaxID=2615069 RepID=UPI00361512B6
MAGVVVTGGVTSASAAPPDGTVPGVTFAARLDSPHDGAGRHAAGRSSTRGPGHGTDEHVDRRNRAEAKAERDVALASTWHLDPGLLVPLPTDSSATTAARQQLGEIDGRMQAALHAYDDARDAADAASLRAHEARTALAAARAAQQAAAARYRADRELMMSVVTEAYSTSQVGALNLLLTADSDEDLVQGLTVLQEMGRTQADAVEAAERSRDRLREATAAVAAAEQEAETQLAAARTTLAAAAVARNRVLGEVRAARDLLESSVIADQAVRDSAADGYRGAISFPLPDGTSFVDQHNFGHRSHHWASVHTGDDFSAGCGTPVLAVTDGTVLVRTDQGWSGRWLVMVSTGPGRLTTWYAHMQALTVAPGQQVQAGQQIGVVGQQGNATGCHLHLEVHPSGGSIYQDDIDPSSWLTTVGAYEGQSS